MNDHQQKVRKTIANYTYELNDIIGCGYSSKVYKGVNTKTNQVVAIKVISFQQLTTPISQSLLKNEINVLRQINHPNLMKVYEIFESKNNTYLVCEYCNEGDLADILETQSLNEAQAIEVFQQIVQGVKALHDKKIIHRDIKPANILKSNNVYKLADFGFAVIENQFESIIKKFNVGTPLYMAPETVNYNHYSEQSDIWSLGIVLYQMIFKHLPFNQKQEGDQTKKLQILIAKVKNDLNISQKVKELLLGMLVIEPDKRMTMLDVLNVLNKEIKRLLSKQHQNIPCKPIRITASSQDFQDSIIQDSQESKYIMKSQPDEIIENNNVIYRSQKHINLASQQLIAKKLINYNNLLSNASIQSTSFNEKKQPNPIITPVITQEKIQVMKASGIKQSSNSQQAMLNLTPLKRPEQFLTLGRLNSSKSIEKMEPNAEKQVPNPQHGQFSSMQKPQQSQPLKTNDEEKLFIKTSLAIEESECIQHSNQNSTNDTIKHTQYSQCQQVFLEKQSTETTALKKNTLALNKSPTRLVQSQRNIATPPFKSSGIAQAKNSQDNKNNYFLPQKSGSPLVLFSSQTKPVQTLQNEKITSDFQLQKNKTLEKEETLSATIRPTFKFLQFLTLTIKKFDCINTEERQKCCFLLRKLQAIKANYLYKYCPSNIQETLKQWIDSFQNYYEKIESVFYTQPDKAFEQYFTKDLSQFNKGFSQLLLYYLQRVNTVLLWKELLVIQEILNENLNQFNDPILFARRWENEQQVESC